MKEYNVLDYITADELKSFRKKIGMTQKEFAKFLGVSKPQVQLYC